MNRAAIIRVLESCASRCLDVEDERERVADAFMQAQERDIDAARIRAFFANAPTDGTRLIAMSASTGKVQSGIIECAARLAGVA